jgi:hypothetical protein
MTVLEHWAAPVCASASIIDLIAIADIQNILRAKAPDRLLDESRKVLRVVGAKLARVNPLRQTLDDLSAPALAIATRTIRMV